MPNELVKASVVNVPATSGTATLPELVERAGGAACFAWDEFFYAEHHNPHTQKAYMRAVKRFLAWAEEQGVELSAITIRSTSISQKRLMASPRIGHGCVSHHRPECTTSFAVDKGDYLRLAITILANGVVKPVHNRMPVLFDPESFDRWLDPNEQRVEVLQAMLVPLPDDWLIARPVSKLVNNPKNEGPRCIEPIS